MSLNFPAAIWLAGTWLHHCLILHKNKGPPHCYILPETNFSPGSLMRTPWLKDSAQAVATTL